MNAIDRLVNVDNYLRTQRSRQAWKLYNAKLEGNDYTYVISLALFNLVTDALRAVDPDEELEHSAIEIGKYLYDKGYRLEGQELVLRKTEIEWRI